MLKKQLLYRVVVGVCLFTLSNVQAQNVQPRLHVLDNGMKLILVKRTGDPSVACGLAFKVGSVNERPGITGISHLFEHMLFKGTKTIGTKDYNADRRIMAQQDSMKALLRQEESKMRAMERLGQIDDMSKRENLTPRYRELEKVFDDLIKQQREIIIKDEMDRIYSKNGGAGLNAFTAEDVTFYIINVPLTSSSCTCGWSPTVCSIRCSANFIPSATWFMKSGACASRARPPENSTSNSNHCSGNPRRTSGR